MVAFIAVLGEVVFSAFMQRGVCVYRERVFLLLGGGGGVCVFGGCSVRGFRARGWSWEEIAIILGDGSGIPDASGHVAYIGMWSIQIYSPSHGGGWSVG